MITIRNCSFISRTNFQSWSQWMLHYVRDLFFSTWYYSKFVESEFHNIIIANYDLISFSISCHFITQCNKKIKIVKLTFVIWSSDAVPIFGCQIQMKNQILFVSRIKLAIFLFLNGFRIIADHENKYTTLGKIVSQ